MDKLKMDVTIYTNLRRAHELAVRKNELYQAMLLVESCGASPELTEAVNKLGERQRQIADELVSTVAESLTY